MKSSLSLWVLFISDVVATGILSVLDYPAAAIVVGSVMTIAWLMCLSASRGTLDVTEGLGEHTLDFYDYPRKMNVFDPSSISSNLDDAFK
jgi:hypothetical protein